MKKCPYCAESIQDEAIVCRHCGGDLTDMNWKEFADRYKAADPATQGKLWADLTEDQRRYFHTNFVLSGPSVQSPPAVNKSTKILIGSIVGIFGVFILLVVLLNTGLSSAGLVADWYIHLAGHCYLALCPAAVPCSNRW